MSKIGIAVLATVILAVFLLALRTWRRAMDEKRYLEKNMEASKAAFKQDMAAHEARTAGNLHKVVSPWKPDGEPSISPLTPADAPADVHAEEAPAEDTAQAPVEIVTPVQPKGDTMPPASA